jgi:hypothetical protein
MVVNARPSTTTLSKRSFTIELVYIHSRDKCHLSPLTCPKVRSYAGLTRSHSTLPHFLVQTLTSAISSDKDHPNSTTLANDIVPFLPQSQEQDIRSRHQQYLYHLNLKSCNPLHQVNHQSREQHMTQPTMTKHHEPAQQAEKTFGATQPVFTLRVKARPRHGPANVRNDLNHQQRTFPCMDPKDVV